MLRSSSRHTLFVLSFSAPLLVLAGPLNFLLSLVGFFDVDVGVFGGVVFWGKDDAKVLVMLNEFVLVVDAGAAHEDVPSAVILFHLDDFRGKGAGAVLGFLVQIYDSTEEFGAVRLGTDFAGVLIRVFFLEIF